MAPRASSLARSCLLGALASAALASPASAGGFAIREQSTQYQGVSFAGNAAGGSLSAMFWNAAAAAAAAAPAGLSFDSNYAAVLGHSEITAGTGTTPVLLGLNNSSGDIAKDAIVPSSYAAYRLNQNAVLALAINSPFGLVTEPESPVWSGQTFSRTSDVKTFNFNPTIAYRLSPTLAVGAGVQIEYIKATLKQASGILPTSQSAVVDGDDWGFGFTLGVLFAPTPATSIGLGLRSAIDNTIEGTFSVNASAAPAVQIEADVTLPEIVTLSLRQSLDPRWTLLGTVEWTNWSRLDRIDIVCAQVASALCPGGSGSTISSLVLDWHDGWFVAAGLELAYSPQLTLRGGIAYEISPIRNASERTTRVPDDDRFWASIGASYKLTPTSTIDLAYTHIFVDDAPIDRSESGLRLVGSADTRVDIVSFGLRTQLGAPPAMAREPLK